MQPKKRPTPRRTPRPRPRIVGKGPRRPVGVQTLGPLRYEQLRQALHQMAVAQQRDPA
jgi:hypothetical protein